MSHKRATNSSWSAPAPADIVHRRAGGRRRYNARRQLDAMIRRMRVREMWLRERAAIVVPAIEPDNLASMRRARVATCNRGEQARIARALGVSRSTVCRDLRRLFRELGVWPSYADPLDYLCERLAELWRPDKGGAAQQLDISASPVVTLERGVAG